MTESKPETEITTLPWAQGYTLLTERTKQWTEAQRRENDFHEKARVFANFSPRDEGRGRILIAKFERPEDAAEVVKRVNSYDSLVRALEAISEYAANQADVSRDLEACDSIEFGEIANMARAALTAAGKGK